MQTPPPPGKSIDSGVQQLGYLMPKLLSPAVIALANSATKRNGLRAAAA